MCPDYHCRMRIHLRQFKLLPIALGVLALNAWGSLPAIAATASQSPAAAARSTFDELGFRAALLGEFFAANGQWKEAFEVYFDLALHNPQPAHFERAVNLALRARSSEQAVRASREWTRAFPNDQQALEKHVLILLATDELTGLQEAMSRWLALSPEAERSQRIDRLSSALRRSPHKLRIRQAAETVFSEYTLVAQTEPAARRALAWISLRDNRTESAHEHVKRLLATGSLNNDTGLLLLALTEKQVAEAEQELLALLKQRQLPQVQLTYAQWLVQKNRYADALRQLNVLSITAPELPAVWLLKGGLEFENQSPALAKPSLEKFLALTQGNAENSKSRSQALIMLSQIAMTNGDAKLAEQWLAQVTDRSVYWDAQLERARIKRKTQGLDATLEWLQQLPTESATDRKRSVLIQAALLKADQAHRRVHQLLSQAAQAFPKDPELLFEWAMASEKLQRWEEFERLMRQVIELKPESANAYNALGYSLADRNIRLSEAKTLIVKALQLSPDDAFILDSLAWVEFRLGNAQLALDLLRKAYAKQPDPEIAAHLGEVLWSLGQTQAARDTWLKALERHPDHPVLKSTLARHP